MELPGALNLAMMFFSVGWLFTWMCLHFKLHQDDKLKFNQEDKGDVEKQDDNC